ncbi:MAG: hypothetical protein ACKVP2_18605 [Burkholderiales bacterium]
MRASIRQPQILTAALLFAAGLAGFCGAGEAAEERGGKPPAAPPSVGGYSNYVGDNPVVYDRYLGNSDPLTEAELLPALMSALDQLTKYPRTTRLPPIQRVPHARIEKLVCNGPCGVLATYRPGEGIYLDERLKPETNLFDRSVLLHELVHFLQDINNEFVDMKDCKRWYHREIEAYAVQKTFLALLGSQIRVGYSAKESTCDGEQQATKNVAN